jgi:hypothetical protein
MMGQIPLTFSGMKTQHVHTATYRATILLAFVIRQLEISEFSDDSVFPAQRE